MGAIFQSILPFSPASEQCADNLRIFAGVEFGTPTRDGHCVNIGICRVTTDMVAIEQKRANPRCRFSLAEIHCDSGLALRIFFPASSMLPCTQRAIFKPGYFPVPVDYLFPADVRELLPAGAPDRIRAGKYRICKDEDGYWVEF